MGTFSVALLIASVLVVALANILDKKSAFFYAYKGWLCIGGGAGILAALFGFIFWS